MKLPIDKEWFEKRAAAEGDLEIGAGNHKLTMTLNLTDAEIATLEQVALEALPAWARDRITVMRAALLAIRDADDIHPDSSTHDVEQSRHRFRDIARHALAGYAPPPQTNVEADERQSYPQSVTVNDVDAARKWLAARWCVERPNEGHVKQLAEYAASLRSPSPQPTVDTVDKARAWDAAQASFQKGYEKGKAEATTPPQQPVMAPDDFEEKLADFLEALDEWGCEDNVERAAQILEFQRAGYDLDAYLVEHPDRDKSELN